ncbi:MAG: hypothetical protein N3J91_08700 [Verrucomicrobiae bacterium]|nr:hypothetical protein [Verrucomicrobiae bacterium]
MLFRLYQALLAAQEAARRAGRRGLDALVRAAGWGPSWEHIRWTFWGRLIPWLAWLAGIGVTLFLGQRAVLPVLYEWQAQRFVRQAGQLAAAGQRAAAAFRLRKALALQPQHPEATRLIARLAEKEDSPTAFLWYWRLVSQPAATTDDRLGLARTALRYERPPFLLASNGLFSIPPAERSNRVYGALLAEYYLKTGQPQRAEAQYEETLRLAPQDVALKVAWLTVRLASRDAEVSRAAAQGLEALADDPVHGLSVCRSLREYYLGENQAAQALPWAQRALRQRGSDFRDQLQYLEALRQFAPEAVTERVGALWAEVSTYPARQAALLQWLLETGQLPLAQEGVSRLSAAQQGHPELRPLVVAVYLQGGRRRELWQWLAGQHWGREDWRRRLLLTRVLRELGREAEARQTWEELLQVAGERPAWLWESARLAQQWDWREALPALTELAVPWLCRDVDEVLRWHTLLEQQGDTLALWRFYQRLCDCQTHWLILNNYAALSLLSGRETNRAHALARQLYLEQPQNEFCATTYAFSLHLQGQTTNGLMVLQRLPRQALERPVIRVYHGILLSAAGRKEAALDCLERAGEAPLLPEERALVEQALARARALPWTERTGALPPRKP